MDGRAEGARDLVLAIFRLSVCDYLGLSYGHDEPDRPRPCRAQQDPAEVLLFLTGTWAADLAEMAGFPAHLVWSEARLIKKRMASGQPASSALARAA